MIAALIKQMLHDYEQELLHLKELELWESEGGTIVDDQQTTISKIKGPGRSSVRSFGRRKTTYGRSKKHPDNYYKLLGVETKQLHGRDKKYYMAVRLGRGTYYEIPVADIEVIDSSKVPSQYKTKKVSQNKKIFDDLN